ncbi:uncharacterized protein LACBIDRAFT_297475 [Laccaria bicolor S238N-H82]|uniref:Predicted protein n=1 Tax=Laccaria bicolor (strain S238N-H82 / ATCC MYA-4686) TaxID=486041 RepID=B0DB94_LACBS|nr:uncharacterized protein LACBIDRAFT_297475 [Laccaria bicolor S238N-H82]EDR07948.1 predicted protein [Laccaria bicolor S238N-H82]|eukprot:XP_001881018.1 predicted protein [Laccaria bicolor S238N-H82]
MLWLLFYRKLWPVLFQLHGAVACLILGVACLVSACELAWFLMCTLLVTQCPVLFQEMHVACLVSAVPCLVLGVACLVSAGDVPYLVSGVACLVSGGEVCLSCFRCGLSCFRRSLACLVSDVACLVSGVPCLVSACELAWFLVCTLLVTLPYLVSEIAVACHVSGVCTLLVTQCLSCFSIGCCGLSCFRSVHSSGDTALSCFRVVGLSCFSCSLSCFRSIIGGCGLSCFRSMSGMGIQNN